MLVVLSFAFVAGILTILAPCTLPVVPLVLGASATGGRRRSIGVVLGFGSTFIALTVVFAAALAAAGLSTDRLRLGSAIVLGIVGLTLALRRVDRWAERGLAPVVSLGGRIVRGRVDRSLIGGLILGGAIGLIWAPCVGPIMASVIAVAATHGPSVETILIATAYVTGATIPIAIVATWGRRAHAALGGAVRHASWRRGFGVAMVLTAAIIVSGLDLGVENAIAAAVPPGWSSALFAIEQQPAIQEELDMLTTDRATPPQTPATATGRVEGPGGLPEPIATTLPANVALVDLGPSPELAGISAWINSEPLTIASLRGKVVLVQFWTFGCINCIHVQPYVKAWYDRYASAGLVVIGVHTPELSFERDLANVRDAVATAEVRFPVAVDPDFTTWNAFRNNYWPAFYFIDKGGQIRHTHFGEGDYEGSERVIRELLDEPGPGV
jgi:cytochrome c biogenesis protein CcdA/thiol-disulfide isomerase/thioredoxin